jgi:hypothetical protein
MGRIPAALAAAIASVLAANRVAAINLDQLYPVGWHIAPTLTGLYHLQDKE